MAANDEIYPQGAGAGGSGSVGEAERLVLDAIEVFRAHAGNDEEAVMAALTERDHGYDQAARLLVFVPLAFCRATLGPAGVAFRENYLVMDDQGQTSSHPLADEPFYQAALCAAGALISRLAEDEYMSIAARSSEYNAIAKALRDGSELSDLELSEPIICW